MSKATPVTLCRFAFVEFATEADAEQALQSSKNTKLNKRSVNVQLYNMQENAYKTKGMFVLFLPTFLKVGFPCAASG